MMITKSRRNQRLPRSQRHGATVVEFALVAPIFCLFVLSSFEFGWLNVMCHTAENAAYEAARNSRAERRMRPSETVPPLRERTFLVASSTARIYR